MRISEVVFKFLFMILLIISFGCKSKKIESSSEHIYNIATYNVRYENKNDNKTGHSWKERKAEILRLIQRHNFDIFGVQEPFYNQIHDMAMALKVYGNFGVSDDNKLNSKSNHHHDIFYNKTKFSLEEQGKFWLSPGAPNSPPNNLMKAAWGGKAKVCIWGKFKDKTSKKVFYVFNTHFYYANEQTQTKSASLIIDKIEEIANDFPVIFMGDLNFNQDSKAYKILENSLLLEDSYKLADSIFPLHEPKKHQTFNHWLTQPKEIVNLEDRIDYIFLSKHWKEKVKSSIVIWDKYKKDGVDKMPSDHNPVMIKLKTL